MKIIFILLFFIFTNSIIFANTEIKKKEITASNIWLKTYKNYKNYNLIISNINKIEQEIEKNKKNLNKVQELTLKLSIYKSKLSLYEKNKTFSDLLKDLRFEIVDITIYDYLFKISSDELNKKIKKYEDLKKQFYIALKYSQDTYIKNTEVIIDEKKIRSQKEQIEYFIEFSENIEKTYQHFFDMKEELEKKYTEYKNEVFIKHLITLGIVISAYISYKFLLFIFFYITRNKENHELEKNYRKILSLLFVLSILIFVVIRYINDLLYIITFLGVVAAALTIATREIILNIAGAIYIFFSNVISQP